MSQIEDADEIGPYQGRAGNEPCRICGKGQEGRPMCYRGLPTCSQLCENALAKEASSELRGDVEAAEKERPTHSFARTSDAATAVCEVCGVRPQIAHPEWKWSARVGWYFSEAAAREAIDGT